MRRILFLLVGIFILGSAILLSGCSDKDKRSKYKNLAHRFSIRYPSTWKLRENFGDAIAMFILPPDPEQVVSIFQSNFSITAQNMFEKGATLDHYSRTVLAEVQKLGQAPEIYLDIVELGSTRLGGRKAQKLIYTFTRYGFPVDFAKQQNIPLDLNSEGASVKLMLVWVIKGQSAYILTYAAAKEDFDEYFEDIEASLKSFQFL